jgi:hypothetical protein
MEKKKTIRSKSMTGISTTVPKEDDFSSVSAEIHTTEPALSTDEYSAAFGEKLSETLDLETWQPGADLVEMYARLESEITDALKEESKYQKDIREKIFPKLRTRPGAPPSAGVYRVGIDRLETVHKQILFNGGVEACDGIVVAHDTLPIYRY